MIAREVQVEGYWRSKYEPDLPQPDPKEHPFKTQDAFLRRLRVLEQKSHRHHYKGWSNCRVCGNRNGSTEHELLGWRWPDGFAHYVSAHNVRPTRRFYDFAMWCDENALDDSEED